MQTIYLFGTNIGNLVLLNIKLQICIIIKCKLVLNIYANVKVFKGSAFEVQKGIIFIMILITLQCVNYSREKLLNF